jgi:hypothetical protein
LPVDDDKNYVRKAIAIDSYSNYQARLGDGQPNQTQTGYYPIVRLTEDYPLILSLYRSSWVVRRVIDTVATDMFKSFPVLDAELDSMQIRAFNKVIGATRTIPRLRSACKWGRLFGGAAGIIIIDGDDDLSKPLEVDNVTVGSFRGIIPLDRWSGIIAGPEINNDINDPDGFGLPSYYNCVMDAGSVEVHHSRVLRFTGRELPQWEVQTELYWGMSEVEVIFDELRKRDYSSWNIVSLLTRSQVLSISEPQLAAMMSGANASNKSYNDFVERMQSISEQMNNQGLLILGKDGKLEQKTYSFGGISDVYHEFMKDLAASTGIPYEIIFGREAGGGAFDNGGSGMSAIQLYDNFIDEKRISEANPVIDKLLPILCMSVFGEVPDDLMYHWNPIRAINDKERSDLGKSLVESVLMAYNADLITKKEARKELAQQSGTNGLFSNITEESIAETPDTYASEAYAGIGMGAEGGGAGAPPPGGAPGGAGPMTLPPPGGPGGGMAGGAKLPSGGGGGSPAPPPPPTSGMGQGPPTAPKPVSGPGSGVAPGGSQPKKGAWSKTGYREGENIPIESKPIGVKSLLWHQSKRITNPSETHRQGSLERIKPALGSGGKTGSVGGQAAGTAKGLEQGLEHSAKHVMKKGETRKPKTFDGSRLGMGTPMKPPVKKEEEEKK